MENGPFTDDFPNKTFIYNGFSIAMLNYQRVTKDLNPTALRLDMDPLNGGSAGGRLQVWNEEAWLILDRSVDTRPCYVCVHDDVLVAAAGDSVMCCSPKVRNCMPYA